MIAVATVATGASELRRAELDPARGTHGPLTRKPDTLSTVLVSRSLFRCCEC